MKVETKGKLAFKLTQEDIKGGLFLLTIDIEDGDSKILLWCFPSELERLKSVLNI